MKYIISIIRRLNQPLQLRLVICGAIAMISAAAEIIAIASFYPLLRFLDTSATSSFTLPIFNKALTIGDLALLSILLVFLSGAVKILYLISSNRLATNLAHYIASSSLYKLYQKPLQWHLSRGSKKLSSIVCFSDNISSGLFIPIMSCLAACSTIVFIAVLSLLASPSLFIAAILLLSTYYVIGYRLSSKVLKRNAQMIGASNIGRLRTLAHSFESIRELKVFQAQQYYVAIFDQYDIPLRRAIANVAILSALPKYFLESFLMITIAVVILVMTSAGTSAISSLVLLILLAQKAVPAAQTLYSSLTVIKSNIPTITQLLDSIHEETHPPLETNSDTTGTYQAPLDWHSTDSLLAVKNLIVSNNSSIIKVDRLNVTHNQLVCVIGRSGSGKSTLVDALLGLSNFSGSIRYKNYQHSSPGELQRQASYSPQSPNFPLLDIHSIIGFADYCIDKPVDIDRTTVLLNQLGLARLCADCGEPLQQEVLSGGEKQRICIARALYPRRDLVILDEPTNGLDPNSKSALLDILLTEKRARSVLTITHDMDLIKLADKIYLMHNERLISIDFSQVASYIYPNAY